jgi:hypothetical protein
MRSMMSLALAAVLAFGACSDDSKATTDGPVVKKDGQVGTPDKPAVIPDGTFTKTILQTVINTLTMPKSATEYGFDYTKTQACTSGATCKNQLGAISAVLAQVGLAGFDFQATIDSKLADGSLIMLFDIKGKTVTDSDPILVKAWMGKDKTTGTTKEQRFNGSAEFTIDATGPTDLSLQGKIAASAMSAGPGNLAIVIPVSGATSPTVSVKSARMFATTADTATNTLTAGKIYGLIPWTDVDTKIIPVIADSVNATYHDATTPESIKNIIKTLIPPDASGNITADQLRKAPTLGLLLAPDVDSTGGSKPDSMSVGLGFTAVKAKFTTP